jgi:hypothetical protein
MANDITMEKWKRYATFCAKHSDKLNDWEIGFIDDIVEMLEMNPPRELSIKRSFKLGEIYHKLVDKDVSDKYLPNWGDFET